MLLNKYQTLKKPKNVPSSLKILVPISMNFMSMNNEFLRMWPAFLVLSLWSSVGTFPFDPWNPPNTSGNVAMRSEILRPEFSGPVVTNAAASSLALGQVGARVVARDGLKVTKAAGFRCLGGN